MTRSLPYGAWAVAWLSVALVVTSTSLAGKKRASKPTVVAEPEAVAEGDSTIRPKLIVESGHSEGIICSALSPDGRLALTGTQDSVVWLWDATTGQAIRNYQLRDNGYLRPAGFSTSGRLLLLRTDKNQLQLRDIASGRLVQTLAGHRDSITSACTSPDDRQVLTASRDRTARIWDLAIGKEVRAIHCPAAVACAIFSGDGRQVITAGEDTAIRVWDAGSGESVRTLEGHGRPVGCLCLSPDGSRLLSGGKDQTARLWDLAAGKQAACLEGHKANVCAVAFSADGRQLITGSDDKSLCVWDAATNKEVRRAVAHFSADRFMHMIDMKTLSRTPDFRAGSTICFSTDGRLAMTSTCLENFARLWDLADGKRICELKGVTQAAGAVAFLSGGRQIYAGGRGIWDLTTGAPVDSLPAKAEATRVIGWAADGGQFLMLHKDKIVRVWDPGTRTEVRRLAVHSTKVEHWVVSADLSRLLVTAGDQGAQVWDTLADKKICQFGSRPVEMRCLALSPDGTRAATGSKDGIVRLWNAVSGEERQQFQGHAGWVSIIVFSPDGSQVLSGGGDNTARLWDFATGKAVQSFQGHTNCIDRVAFSPDGRQVLTGGLDRTARLWDPKTGKEKCRFRGHTNRVSFVASSPDGRWVLTASADHTVRLWDASTGKERCQLLQFPAGGWAVVDDAGRYDASDAGHVDGLHWAIGSERVTLDQLKDRYYEPGLLAKITGFNREPLREVADLAAPRLYPAVELIEPTPQEPTLSVRLTDQGGGIGRVVVRINGKQITGDARGRDADPHAKQLLLKIPLANDPRIRPGAKNLIEVEAYNAAHYLRSRPQKCVYRAPGEPVATRTQLWAIVAGVSRYRNETLNLRYAARDADDFAQALKASASRLFGPKKVHVTLLSTSGSDASTHPTRDNLTKAFVAAQAARPGDILVVFLAGHGASYGGQDGDFYYRTCDALSFDLTDPEVRRQTALASNEFIDWITRIPADKQVLILDTCASGRMAQILADKRGVPSSQIRALERVKDATGMHVLAGCSADQSSYETSRFGQGLLTHCLLLGIQGAALRESQFVDVVQLFSFAEDQVPQLARGIGGIQRPVMTSPRESRSFDLGQVTAENRAKIPFHATRPWILRSSFQEEEKPHDILGLARQIDEKLRDLSFQEPEPPVAFVDADELPEAFTVSGRYRIEREKIEVRVSLFRGSMDLAQFSVSGPKDRLEPLAQRIVEEIIRRLPADH